MHLNKNVSFYKSDEFRFFRRTHLRMRYAMTHFAHFLVEGNCIFCFNHFDEVCFGLRHRRGLLHFEDGQNKHTRTGAVGHVRLLEHLEKL